MLDLLIQIILIVLAIIIAYVLFKALKSTKMLLINMVLGFLVIILYNVIMSFLGRSGISFGFDPSTLVTIVVTALTGILGALVLIILNLFGLFPL